MNNSIDYTNHLLRKHLEKFNLYDVNDRSWSIKESNLSNRGIFAVRDLKPGEIIFKDKPIIFGPRFGYDPLYKVCVNCNNNCDNLCPKGCGLLLCVDCIDNSDHSKECEIILKWRDGRPQITQEESNLLTRTLCAIRALSLNDEFKCLVKMLMAHQMKQHALEVYVLKSKLKYTLTLDDERLMSLVCAVMDANAFEVPVKNSNGTTLSMRGLYPLGSLANHSCLPNSMHLYDENQTMIFKAAVEIKKGQEIFTSYTRLLWGTPTRRYHLSVTKKFGCKCDRCTDPTELGSHMDTFTCQFCNVGYCVSQDPLTRNADWKCIDCNKVVPSKNIGTFMSVIGSRLKNFDDCDVDEKLNFIDKELLKLMPSSNQIIIRIKYNLIWVIGHKVGYKWNEISNELLEKKRSFCDDILNLIDKLGLGLCKMRGLVLNELGCCLREMITRRETLTENREINDDEASTVTATHLNVNDEEKNNESTTVKDLEVLMQEAFNEARHILSGDMSTHAEVLVYP